MKKLCYLCLGILVPMSFLSCEKIKGKGEVVTETREITGFTGISLAIDATILFTPDSVYFMEVSAQQNILDVLRTSISNGKLIVSYQSNVIVGKHEPITIRISAPDVSSLNISGSGDIDVLTTWIGHYLETDISGSGNLTLADISANEIDSKISGSGNIHAESGLVNYEQLRISGSGDIDLLQVEADTVYADISGSGDIKVTVHKFLDVSISGSGNVGYHGTPAMINTRISGSGTVYPVNP